MSEHHWTGCVMASLDFETTSVNPLEARAVQAALAVGDAGGRVFARMCFIVDPGIEIPAEASAIHGITTEKARSEGCSPAVMILRLLSALQCFNVHDGRVPLVIYNAPYDWPVLLQEAKRCELPVHCQPLFLDPLCLDRTLDRYRKGSRKLQDVAQFYGVKLNGAHDALSDAIAALGVIRAMIHKYPNELGGRSLSEMQAFQAGGYCEWRDHLNEYWERIGKADRVTGTWPLNS